MQFTTKKVDTTYLKEKDLLKYFNKDELKNIDYEYDYTDPLFGCKSDNPIPYPIDVKDLINLHRAILKRKVFTVLEFGLGYSTLVMADALLQHKKIYESLEVKPHIRCSTMFQLHCVDSNEYWINEFKKKLQCFPELSEVIHITYSTVKVGTFNDRLCHYYENLPNVVPHLVYLDAPGTHDVEGDIRNASFNKNCDRTVMSGDLLFIEPTFLPGMKIIVDGRTNNANFMQNNFQRNYIVEYSEENDVTSFELYEKPLGKYNKNMLDYCNLKYT